MTDLSDRAISEKLATILGYELDGYGYPIKYKGNDIVYIHPITDKIQFSYKNKAIFAECVIELGLKGFGFCYDEDGEVWGVHDGIAFLEYDKDAFKAVALARIKVNE